MLFDGSTTRDQKVINCQRPIHGLSISQLQTRKDSDCTMGTKELLLSPMHGALAAMKHYDLECVSMDFQWPSTWSPDCQKCLPVLVSPGVDEIPLLVLASCQSRDPMQCIEHGNILLCRALRILCRWLHSNTLGSVVLGAVIAIAVV